MEQYIFWSLQKAASSIRTENIHKNINYVKFALRWFIVTGRFIEIVIHIQLLYTDSYRTLSLTGKVIELCNWTIHFSASALVCILTNAHPTKILRCTTKQRNED